MFMTWIRIRVCRADPGSGSEFAEQIQDPDPSLQSRSRIRIRVYRADPWSGSEFTEQIQDPDLSLQRRSRIRIRVYRADTRSRIRIRVYRADTRSGSEFTEQIQDPDPHQNKMDPITLQSITIFVLFQSLLMSPVGPYLTKLNKINVSFYTCITPTFLF